MQELSSRLNRILELTRLYMNSISNKKIYVVSAGKKNNGGGETLHQLVDALNNYSENAYIYYADENLDSIVYDMRKYNVNLAERIEDDANNIVICPEMYTKYVSKIKHARVIIWFLSRDYYLLSKPEYRTNVLLAKYHVPRIFFPIMYCLTLMFTYASLNTIDIEKAGYKLYLYNCEYARLFIESRAKYEHESIYICGPVNEIYYSNYQEFICEKEPIVAYNPAKATEYTLKLIDHFAKRQSDVRFIPVTGMPQKKVCELLKKTSVYMDLGLFPGPERMPREAALMGCNIIVSYKGSAMNDIDVPIPRKYKFELIEDNLDAICDAIEELVKNYNLHFCEYNAYRKKVLVQKGLFDEGVKELIKRIDG